MILKYFLNLYKIFDNLDNIWEKYCNSKNERILRKSGVC